MDWSMGGYGFYVWGSYLVALLAMGGEVLALVKRTKALRKGKQTSSVYEKVNYK